MIRLLHVVIVSAPAAFSRSCLERFVRPFLQLLSAIG
jgi:peroxiredoxin